MRTESKQDQHLINQYEMLERKVEVIERRKALLEAELKTINQEMSNTEKEWLKDHSCSCGLLDLPCSCEQ